MKNLFMLALALVMTCTFAFAASQSPESMGKYYGEKLIKYAVADDFEAVEKLSTEAMNYIDQRLETEEQAYEFISGLEAGIRKACNDLGLGDEVADMLIEQFAASMLEEAY